MMLQDGRSRAISGRTGDIGWGILTCQRGPDGINAEPFCTYKYTYIRNTHCTYLDDGGHHVPFAVHARAILLRDTT